MDDKVMVAVCVWRMVGLCSLTWLSRIALWGWVRLHTCYTSNLHTQTFEINPISNTTTLCRWSGGGGGV